MSSNEFLRRLARGRKGSAIGIPSLEGPRSAPPRWSTLERRTRSVVRSSRTRRISADPRSLVGNRPLGERQRRSRNEIQHTLRPQEIGRWSARSSTSSWRRPTDLILDRLSEAVYADPGAEQQRRRAVIRSVVRDGF